MIRVSKNLNNVPLSLDEKKTQTRRNTCIRDKKYHQNKKFDQRYKQKDVKESLATIYHNKCAFCEQEVIECTDNILEECSSTIEHYRPKSKYYWLAFSWDNLLWCCCECNKTKDNNFEIKNDMVSYDESFQENIHSSSDTYESLEKAKMVHPEFESILDKLQFKNGIISSDDLRVNYTIENCALDRKTLNEIRLPIIEDFKEAIDNKKLKNESITDVLKEWISDIQNKEKEFIALRYWILNNYESLIDEK